MTSMPAQKLGLWDRGLVCPWMAAGLVAFDAATVLSRATYEDPEQPQVWLPYVIVNGTATRPRRPLHRGLSRQDIAWPMN